MGEENKRTESFTQNKEAKRNLLNKFRADSTICLQQVACYLENDQGLKLIEILILVDALIRAPEAKEYLLKIKGYWLLLNIYKKMGFIKNIDDDQNVQNRRKVRERFKIWKNIDSHYSRNSIISDDQFKVQYASFETVFKLKADKELKICEKAIDEIFNNEISQGIIKTFDESIYEITQYDRFFHNPDDLAMTQKIQKIIKDYSQKLINLLDSSPAITSEKNKKIRFFKRINGNFLRNLADKFDDGFTDECNMITKFIQLKDIKGIKKEMSDKLKIRLSTSEQLKLHLAKQFYQKLKNLKEKFYNYMHNPIRQQDDGYKCGQVTDKNVKSIDKKIQDIKWIKYLNIMDINEQKSKQFEQELDKLSNECTKTIQNLRKQSNLNGIMNTQQIQKSKNKIDLFMKIDYLRMKYQGEYEDIITSTFKGYLQTIQYHFFALVNLEKSNLYHQKLQIIRQTVDKAKNYQQIMNNFDQTKEFRKSFNSKYENHLKAVLKKMQANLKLNLGQINNVFFQKICFYSQIVSIYSNLAIYEDQSNQLLQSIGQAFLKCIQNVFVKFYQEVMGTNVNQPFNYCIYNGIAENYCFFVLELKKKTKQKQYEQAFGQMEVKNIKQIFQWFFKGKIDKFQKFLNLHYCQQYECPQFLLDLIDKLLKIKSLASLTNYLKQSDLTFDVQKNLKSLEYKLSQINKAMKLTCWKSQDRVTLKKLHKDCQFFIQVEKIYTGHNLQSKFGFGQLLEKIKGLSKNAQKQDKQQSILAQRRVSQKGNCMEEQRSNSQKNAQELMRYQIIKDQDQSLNQIQSIRQLLKQGQFQEQDQKSQNQMNQVSQQYQAFVFPIQSRVQSQISSSLSNSMLQDAVTISYYQSKNKCVAQFLKKYYIKRTSQICKNISAQEQYLKIKYINITKKEKDTILTFQMQRGNRNYSQYDQLRIKAKTQAELIAYLIKNKLIVDYIISIPISVKKLELLGVFHKDICMRNSIQLMHHIQIHGQIFYIFKLIDFDCANQAKNVDKYSKNGYQLTKKMMRDLLDCKQFQIQHGIRQIYCARDQELDQSTIITKIKAIIDGYKKEKKEKEATVHQMMEALQQYMYQCHQQQFLSMIRKLIIHLPSQYCSQQIKQKMEGSIKRLKQSKPQDSNRYEIFSEEWKTIKADVKDN